MGLVAYFRNGECWKEASFSGRNGVPKQINPTSAKLQVMHLKTNLSLLNFAYIQLTVSFCLNYPSEFTEARFTQETSWWRSVWAVHRDALLARFLPYTYCLGTPRESSPTVPPFLPFSVPFGVCSMSRVPFIVHLHIMCMYRKEGWDLTLRSLGASIPISVNFWMKIYWLSAKILKTQGPPLCYDRRKNVILSEELQVTPQFALESTLISTSTQNIFSSEAIIQKRI